MESEGYFTVHWLWMWEIVALDEEKEEVFSDANAKATPGIQDSKQVRSPRKARQNGWSLSCG